MSRVKPAAGPSLERALAAVAEPVRAAMTEAGRRLGELGIRHAIVGGLAVGVYGAPRNTTDVDFLVGIEAFEGSGLVLTHRAGVPVRVGEVAVDLIPAEEPALERALAEGTEVAPNLRVVPLPVLIQMKLRALRPHDQDDVLRLIQAGADLGEIREYLRTEEPALLSRLDYVLRGGAPTV
jgi:hypothetical protein